MNKYRITVFKEFLVEAKNKKEAVSKSIHNVHYVTRQIITADRIKKSNNENYSHLSRSDNI